MLTVEGSVVRPGATDCALLYPAVLCHAVLGCPSLHPALGQGAKAHCRPSVPLRAL